MKKQTETLYIYLRKYFLDGVNMPPHTEFSSVKLESTESFTYVLIGTKEIDFSFDDNKLHEAFNAEKITTLEKARTELLASTEIKVNNLDQQIQELKCLEVK